jgi:hypothetical protein
MQRELTAERLRELLSYDPETGVFTWRVTRGGGAQVGSVAGAIDRHGYRHIKLDYRLYRAHRLAWLYVYGAFPSKELDHINRLRDCNAISNLREATRSENGQNKVLQANNTSGFKGVSWDKRARKWAAQIALNGKNKFLGRFSTPHEAHLTYLAAAAEMHACHPVLSEAP